MENKKLTYLGSVDCCLGDSISLELKNGNMLKFNISDVIVNDNPDLFKLVEDKTEIEYLNVSADIIKLRKQFETFSDFWKSCSNEQILEISKALGLDDDINYVYSAYNDYKCSTDLDYYKFREHTINNLDTLRQELDSIISNKFSSLLRDKLTEKVNNIISSSSTDKNDEIYNTTELNSNDNFINYMEEYYEALGLSKSDVEKINDFFKIKINL